MKFRTEIDIPGKEKIITPETIIFSAGSCFAGNIAAKLKRLKFNISSNPFGVLFNPLSLLNMTEVLTGKIKLSEDDLVFHNGLWNSFYHNSEFSGEDKASTQKLIDQTIQRESKQFSNSDIFIFTFGTSFVYFWKESGFPVSNCHKIPSHKFERRMLTLEENIEAIEKIIVNILSINSKAKIILTVSPVRHLKDGLHQNQLSKASLLLAVDHIIHKYENVDYFPAYEILLDDLRDYRFYDVDLTHPSNEAIEYIWEKFQTCYFTPAADEFAKEMNELATSLEHRILHPGSQNSKDFAISRLKLIGNLNQKYPNLNFEKEEEHFNKILNFSG